MVLKSESILSLVVESSKADLTVSPAVAVSLAEKLVILICIVLLVQVIGPEVRLLFNTHGLQFESVWCRLGLVLGVAPVAAVDMAEKLMIPIWIVLLVQVSLLFKCVVKFESVLYVLELVLRVAPVAAMDPVRSW